MRGKGDIVLRHAEALFATLGQDPQVSKIILLQEADAIKQTP